MRPVRGNEGWKVERGEETGVLNWKVREDWAKKVEKMG